MGCCAKRKVVKELTFKAKPVGNVKDETTLSVPSMLGVNINTALISSFVRWHVTLAIFSFSGGNSIGF